MIPSSDEVQKLKIAISSGKNKLQSFLSSGSVSKLPEHILNLQKELVKKYGMLEDLALAREDGKLLKDPHLYNLHSERLEYAFTKMFIVEFLSIFVLKFLKAVSNKLLGNVNDALLTFSGIALKL